MLVPGHYKTYANSQNLFKVCLFFKWITHGVFHLKVGKDNVDAATDALANNFTDALANTLDVSNTNRLFW